jgi:DNA-directed RNA polymerase specialized sigma24 family protein
MQTVFAINISVTNPIIIPSVLTGTMQKAFPNTEWPLVCMAGGSASKAKQAALQAVLVRYLPVLKEYLIRRYAVSEDQAADWLQSFVLEKVLLQDLIAHADHSRGRFRTFLLRSLQNFVIQQIRRQSANKRCPQAGMVSLEEVTESALPIVPGQGDEAFDVTWASGILSECLQRMQRYCTDTHRPDIWGVFNCRILKPLLEEQRPMPYEQLVARFKLRSPSHASNLFITAQRMFARYLRAVIAEYAKDPDEVESEIQELKAVLFRAGDRLGSGSPNRWIRSAK